MRVQNRVPLVPQINPGYGHGNISLILF